MVSGACLLWMKARAYSKNSFTSLGFLLAKNSGLAVIRVYTTRTLAFLARHPASEICFSASAQ